MCWQSKHAAEGVFRKRPNERTASRWVKSLKQSTSVVLPGQPADRDYAFITAFLEKLKELNPGSTGKLELNQDDGHLPFGLQ